MPPGITGRQLVSLLKKDGWIEGNRTRHGIFLWKRFPGETIPRTIVVPSKNDELPEGTLGVILGVKQTRLGKAGLLALIQRYGQP